MSESFLIVAQLVLRYGPEFVAKLVEIFGKDDPKKDEILALFDKVKPYSAYVSEEDKKKLLP